MAPLYKSQYSAHSIDTSRTFASWARDFGDRPLHPVVLVTNLQQEVHNDGMKQWNAFILSWLCHRSVHAAVTPCSSSQSSHRCGATVNGGEHVEWQPGHLSKALVFEAVSAGRILSEESGSGSETEESVNMSPVPPSPLSTSTSSPPPSPSPPLPPSPPPTSPGSLCGTASCQGAVWGAAAVWLILCGAATLLVMRRRIQTKHTRRTTPTHVSETELTETQLECPPFEQLEMEERTMHSQPGRQVARSLH